MNSIDRMNPVDRAIFWFLVTVIPRQWHYWFPRWLKRILNRWMKHRGDPGDRR
jgi:hypothetical protein